MKLHKKKVKLLLACIVILTIVTSVLCSFAPPTIGWTVYSVYTLTETDVENIMAITDFQTRYGSFNSFVPVACHLNNSTVRLYLVPSNANWTFTESNETYTLTTGSNNVMRTQLTREGFGLLYTGNTATIESEHLLFYRSGDGTLVKGEAFNYAAGTDNDVIADCAAAWFETWSVVNGYESALDEAESEGYESGFNQGYADGLDQGFADGLEEGESRGYESGLADGYTDGFDKGVQAGYNSGLSDGYDSGFEDGYTEGYDDGYAAAEPGDGEVVTEIVYRDPVEINVGEVISGISSMPQNLIGSAFGFELFGINIAGLLTTLIVLAVGGFIVGLFIKKR